LPDDASTGLTPQRAAKDASVASRSGLSPAAMRSVGADAVDLEQAGSGGDALAQVVDLGIEVLDAAGEVPQGMQGRRGCVGRRGGVPFGVGWEGEVCTSGDEPPGALRGQVLAEDRGGVDQHRLELVDRLHTGLARRVLGDLKDSERLDRPVTGLRCCGRVPGQYGMGCGLGVYGVFLAAPAPR
jgi:hypothetical protein